MRVVIDTNDSSGDEHLLAVTAFRDIPILTVSQFLGRLNEMKYNRQPGG